MKYLFLIIIFISFKAHSQNFSFFHSQLSNKCSTPRKSCLEHLKAGCNVSQVYKIKITGETQILNLYCDQQTDGGGWTLVTKIERNVTPGSLDFEGTVTNNTQATSNSAVPTVAQGLNVNDLSGLTSPTLSNRSGYAVKVSNARINALKSSTAANVAAYRLEKLLTSGGPNVGGYRKLFYPGNCIFQKHSFGSFGTNTGCQKAATTYDATNFVSGGISWCNQNNMPTQYFCSEGGTGLLRLNDTYTNSDGHNYFDHLLWIR